MINRLHRLGATIDRQPCQAISPLHYGCWNGCQAAVAELLRLGVIVDVAVRSAVVFIHLEGDYALPRSWLLCVVTDTTNGDWWF